MYIYIYIYICIYSSPSTSILSKSTLDRHSYKEINKQAASMGQELRQGVGTFDLYISIFLSIFAALHIYFKSTLARPSYKEKNKHAA